MIDFPELQALVNRMGASLSSWRLPPYETTRQRKEREEREKLRRELRRGIEVKNLDEVKPYDDLLTHKGEQIVIYIKDNTRQDKYTLLDDPKNARRFHVAECKTIREMRTGGHFDRYVMTDRQDGKFLVEARDSNGAVVPFEAPLYVCKNCLGQLNWKGYASSRSDKLWKEFSLQDFFAEFTTFFSVRPLHTALTALPAGYAKNWCRRSTKLRHQRGWRCDECVVNLSAHRRLLHCHHKNGVTQDNRPENIAVLCLLCHSKQPYHGHVSTGAAERQIIESLRNEQRSQPQNRQPTRGYEKW